MATAEVLREQETLPSAGADAMDFPAASPAPLARAAAPAPLPMAPTLADVAQDLGPLGGALANSRDAEKQQMQIRANAMRPEYASIRQATDAREALAQNAPKPPALATPPSLGLREFLATSENESPTSAISKLIQAASLFANVAIGGTRQNALGGMAAMAGALAGWQAGDADRAGRAFRDWEAQTGKALKEYDLQRTAYTDALTASGLTLDGRIQKARLTALEQGDTQAMLAFESGTIGEMLDLLSKRDDAKAKLAIEYQKVIDRRAEAEAKLEEAKARREDLNAWRESTAEYRRAILDDRAAARADRQAARDDGKVTPPGELKTIQANAMSRAYVTEMKRLVPEVRMDKIVGGLNPWLNQIDQTGRIGPIPLPKEILGQLTDPERRLLALTEDYADKILRDRSGAAVTDSEFVRMLRFLVSGAVTPQAFMARLQLQDDILRGQDETQRAVLKGGGYIAPSITPPTLDSGPGGPWKERKGP